MDSFLDFLDPPPPSWTILLNKAYVIIWTFRKPLPLPFPHGLWMTPKLGTSVLLYFRFYVTYSKNTSLKILFRAKFISSALDFFKMNMMCCWFNSILFNYSNIAYYYFVLMPTKNVANLFFSRYQVSFCWLMMWNNKQNSVNLSLEFVLYSVNNFSPNCNFYK